MSDQTNTNIEVTSSSAQGVRQINHIVHHRTSSSKTLMRHAVSKPNAIKVNKSRQAKAHAINYHQELSYQPQRVVNQARLERAKNTQTNTFVSHFAKPDTQSFFRHNPQPIKAIMHKPKIEASELGVNELLEKTMERVSNELKTLEQVPVRRIQRFTRSLVANRYNGIALD